MCRVREIQAHDAGRIPHREHLAIGADRHGSMQTVRRHARRLAILLAGLPPGAHFLWMHGVRHIQHLKDRLALVAVYPGSHVGVLAAGVNVAVGCPAAGPPARQFLRLGRIRDIEEDCKVIHRRLLLRERGLSRVRISFCVGILHAGDQQVVVVRKLSRAARDRHRGHEFRIRGIGYVNDVEASAFERHVDCTATLRHEQVPAAIGLLDGQLECPWPRQVQVRQRLHVAGLPALGQRSARGTRHRHHAACHGTCDCCTDNACYRSHAIPQIRLRVLT